MSKNEREALHLKKLGVIGAMKVMNRGTETVNRERTMIHIAEVSALEVRSHEATERGCEAMERLLSLAENARSGQIETVAKFLSGIWGASHFDPFAMRSVDTAIGDDFIAVLDAIRWGRVSVKAMADRGAVRVPNALRIWGLQGRGDDIAGSPRVA